MEISEWKKTLADMKRNMMADGLPRDVIDRVEAIGQINIECPEIGGMLGFIKGVDEERGLVRMLMVSPVPTHSGVDQGYMSLMISVEAVSLVGATTEVLVSDDGEDVFDKIKEECIDKVLGRKNSKKNDQKVKDGEKVSTTGVENVIQFVPRKK